MIEKLLGLNKFLIATNIKIMKTMRVTFVIFVILKISILVFEVHIKTN